LRNHKRKQELSQKETRVTCNNCAQGHRLSSNYIYCGIWGKFAGVVDSDTVKCMYFEKILEFNNTERSITHGKHIANEQIEYSCTELCECKKNSNNVHILSAHQKL